MFPAVFGSIAWFAFGNYSVVYSVINALWGIVFIEYWKRKEVDLSCRWETKNVSVVRTKRKEFHAEKQVLDPATGESVGTFSVYKRFARQILQVPFVFLSAGALGAIIATCFAIEIFISEIYTGPFKQYLVGFFFFFFSTDGS